MRHAVVDLLEGMIRFRDDVASGRVASILDASGVDRMARLGGAMEIAIADLDAMSFPLEGDVETGARIALAQEALRRVLAVMDETADPVTA